MLSSNINLDFNTKFLREPTIGPINHFLKYNSRFKYVFLTVPKSWIFLKSNLYFLNPKYTLVTNVSL